MGTRINPIPGTHHYDTRGSAEAASIGVGSRRAFSFALNVLRNAVRFVVQLAATERSEVRMAVLNHDMRYLASGISTRRRQWGRNVWCSVGGVFLGPGVGIPGYREPLSRSFRLHIIRRPRLPAANEAGTRRLFHSKLRC